MFVASHPSPGKQTNKTTVGLPNLLPIHERTESVPKASQFLRPWVAAAPFPLSSLYPPPPSVPPTVAFTSQRLGIELKEQESAARPLSFQAQEGRRRERKQRMPRTLPRNWLGGKWGTGASVPCGSPTPGSLSVTVLSPLVRQPPVHLGGGGGGIGG